MSDIAYKSDIGRVRDLDEDSIAVVRLGTSYSSERTEISLLILADGLGGYNAGETASYLGVKTVAEFVLGGLLSKNKKNFLKEIFVPEKLQSSFWAQFAESKFGPNKKPIVSDSGKKNLGNGNYGNLLKSAILEANNEILDYATENPECSGMGTTVVAAILENGNLYVGNVGDGRLYIVSKDEIRQITVDHTLADGTLTRAVGISPSIEIDTFEIKLVEGDIILVCCDGLTDVVEESRIMEIILDNNTNDACNKLIELANERRGPDNISVIIAKMEE